eukprot:1014559-Rhodomonas_salina.1
MKLWQHKKVSRVSDTEHAEIAFLSTCHDSCASAYHFLSSQCMPWTISNPSLGHACTLGVRSHVILQIVEPECMATPASEGMDSLVDRYEKVCGTFMEANLGGFPEHITRCVDTHCGGSPSAGSSRLVTAHAASVSDTA